LFLEFQVPEEKGPQVLPVRLPEKVLMIGAKKKVPLTLWVVNPRQVVR